MSRYTGPRVKILRRFGMVLPGLTTKTIPEKKSYAPGEHGPTHRPKASEYREHLDEKQKVRLNYGLSERQFVNYMKAAIGSKIDTGLRLVQLLEGRLDNVVFRAGYARTIPAARQLVNHGHVLVNGKKVDIASYLCKVGDVISFKGDTPLKVAKECIDAKITAAPFVTVDADKISGIFTRKPERNELPNEIQESQIIEYYNRKL